MVAGTSVFINQWNQSAYNFLKPIIRQEGIDTKQKVELMIDLAAKQRILVSGGRFMLNNEKHHFEEFEQALRALKFCKTKNSENLSMVEELLQRQVTALLNMNTTQITKEEKSFCLYTLQNMALGLSDIKLEKEENTYVPKILQDKDKVMAKADEKGLDLDKVNNYINNREFCVPGDKTLGNWEFLDLRRIKEVDDIMLSHFSSAKLDQFRRDEDLEMAIPENTSAKFDHGIIVNECQDIDKQKIGMALSEISQMFTAEAIKANPEKFFQCVHQNLSGFNIDRDTIFTIAKDMASMIAKNNAKIQESIYKENINTGKII